MKLKEGQYVRHSQYGWGTVLDCDNHSTTVIFRSSGLRLLAPTSSTSEARRPERSPRPEAGRACKRCGQGPIGDGFAS